MSSYEYKSKVEFTVVFKKIDHDTDVYALYVTVLIPQTCQSIYV